METLVLQLKESVANDNLGYLNKLVIDANSIENFHIGAVNGGVTVIAEDCEMRRSTGAVIGSVWKVNEPDVYIILANKGTKPRLYIENDFNISAINFGGIFLPKISVKDIDRKYVNLTSIQLQDSNVFGDINDFMTLKPKLLYLYRTSVEGDVTEWLNNLAKRMESGSEMILAVSENCINRQGIGIDYSTRKKVTFNGTGGYTISNP